MIGTECTNVKASVSAVRANLQQRLLIKLMRFNSLSSLQIETFPDQNFVRRQLYCIWILCI